MTPADELAGQVRAATVAGARGKLVARGLARGMIWQDGRLPPDAPAFAASLTTDLLDHGYSVLAQALSLRDAGGHAADAEAAFRTSAEAIESAVRKGDPADPDRMGHVVVAAAAFHLGHYAARSFCLIPEDLTGLNLSTSERAVALLMRRGLRELRDHCASWLADPDHSDAVVAARLERNDDDFGPEDVLSLSLTRNLLRGVATFDLALQDGDGAAFGRALEILRRGEAASSRAHSVPHWWSHTLARHLIDDLWDLSLHQRLPVLPNGDADAARWAGLRWWFIVSVGARRVAQIELWPSQTEAARRAVDPADDLVVALPTSAGKTRIAELCILRALAAGRRVIYVTPLRALSAQIERGLAETFRPLGYPVTSLYGSAGVAAADVTSLKATPIVVATPEKLDFAVRQEPSVIDDVGCVVLDEGHMIGLGVREIRYEVLVQRLLRRPDAAGRRLVCLSAIFKAGETFDDFTAWLRQDRPGPAVRSDWRPTRQRPAALTWANGAGRLQVLVEGERPFVPRFVQEEMPAGRRQKAFPNTSSELVVATAKRLVRDRHRVLVYCPQRSSVESLAHAFLTAGRQGHFPTMLADAGRVARAKRIGTQWLGAEHVAVRSLSLGVAVHHGALPRPFLTEVERLLNDKVLPVAIASPTLAQGVDLSSSALIFNSLYRAGEAMRPAEFANVIGRAGRAYVDLDGLILLPIFDPSVVRKRLDDFTSLIRAASDRSMESGLFQLVDRMASRLGAGLGIGPDRVIEYVANHTGEWELPPPTFASARPTGTPEAPLSELLAELDAALLATIDPLDCDPTTLARALDAAFRGSLWRRRLARTDPAGSRLQQAIVTSRAGWLWRRTNARQRRGYFAAGIGQATGAFIDAHLGELLPTLLTAERAVADGDARAAAAAACTAATLLFSVYPFQPKTVPSRWPRLIDEWLAGRDLGGVLDPEQASEEVQFIQDAVVYRLVWAVEAVRVHVQAIGRPEASQLAGALAFALTCGAPSVHSAMLVEAGLTSRSAAVAIVSRYPPTFTDRASLVPWVESVREAVRRDAAWGTPLQREAWEDFVDRLRRTTHDEWVYSEEALDVVWDGPAAPAPGTRVRLADDAKAGVTRVCREDLIPLGVLAARRPQASRGWVQAAVQPGGLAVGVKHWRPPEPKASGSSPLGNTFVNPSER